MNSAYVELLGSGGMYSVNYDRLLTNWAGARIGFSYFNPRDPGFTNESVMTIPVMLNVFVGDGNSRFEFGAGILYLSVSGNYEFLSSGSTLDASAIWITTAIGYRYQPTDGGFLFRVNFTPIFGAGHVMPFAGISAGVAF